MIHEKIEVLSDKITRRKTNLTNSIKLKSHVYYELSELTMLMKEVLPDPLGPSIPKHCPLGKASDNPLTATLSGFPFFPGYNFFRLSQMTMPLLPIFFFSNRSTTLR
jgi:hypothetical protein